LATAGTSGARGAPAATSLPGLAGPRFAAARLDGPLFAAIGIALDILPTRLV